MRSASEIAFRLRQELNNLRFFLASPKLADVPPARPLACLPDPEELRDAVPDGFAADLYELADKILRHEFPLLGTEIHTGPAIRWRRDALRDRETETKYFRLIPYLDVARAGDHKIIWELNRHQHLVILAQAWLCSGREQYLDELFAQIENWSDENPFQRGINWASALEVAFRALSWIWIYHLTGSRMNDKFRRRFLEDLYHHGAHLESNLSIYFSPNTHLLGEAVALHALGRLFPFFPGADGWRRRGGELVEVQIYSQVRADGSHFEQSSYYHVYAVDFFLFFALLENVSDDYRTRLKGMCEFLSALMGQARRLPLLGDDDGGRFFHPYGDRDLFGRATLATAAVTLGHASWNWSTGDLTEQAFWWLGPERLAKEHLAKEQPRSEPLKPAAWFPVGGIAALTAGPWEVIVDAGPFGSGSGGHSHSDTLAVVLRHKGQDILIDPGTYTYVGDPEWRERFRGTAAHNTVRINRLDQATPQGPFRWVDKPGVSVNGVAHDYIDAVCEYRGFAHRRRVKILSEGVFVLDEISGPAGEHEVEQFWHAGGEVEQIDARVFRISGTAVLSLSAPATVLEGWVSPALGAKKPAAVICVPVRNTLPVVLAAVILEEPYEVTFGSFSGRWVITAGSFEVEFPK